MKDGAEGLRDEISMVVREPKHTCPHIDAIIKEARSHSRDMAKAYKRIEETEDPTTYNALGEAESFADSLDGKLEDLRSVNGDLRTRGNRMEEIAEEAVDRLEAAEARILELETQLRVGDKVRQSLVVMIQETWWHRAKTIAGTIALALADRAKIAFWRSRARALAITNKRIRSDRYLLHEAVNDQAYALGEIAAYLGTLEWAGKPWGDKVCPECRTTWKAMTSIFPPDHAEGCHLGRMARMARRAIHENPPTREEA